jgi:acyl carrier protein
MADAIDDAVRQVLSAIFGRPIAAEEPLSAKTEPTWDSLRQVEVLLAVEGALEVRFDEDEMPQLDSVEKLVRSVKRHRAA